MARSKAPRRLYPGVWREGDHLVAEASAGNSRTGKVRDRKHFPLGTDYRSKILPWQLSRQSELLRERPEVAERGSLAADVARYQADLPEGTAYTKNSAQILAHWARSPLGKRPTLDLVKHDLKSQIARWLAAPHAASVNSCNKRLTKFRMMFEALYPAATNHALLIKFTKEPESEVRDISPLAVQAILDALPDLGRAEKGGERPGVSETKLRLAVMAWTGAQGATLRRVTTQHIDLKGGRIYLTARRKGKGTPGRWLSLIPNAIPALGAFVAAGLVGKPWARSSMRKTWLRGIARAKDAAAGHFDRTGDRSWLDDLEALPPNCHPYDLRHGFASEVYRQTGDLGAVKELLQHANFETTQRYTKGAVSERVQAATKIAGAAYAKVPSMPKAPTLHLVKKTGTK